MADAWFIQRNEAVPLAVTAATKLQAICFHGAGDEPIEHGIALDLAQLRRNIKTDFKAEFLKFA